MIIHGDAYKELPKLDDRSVDCIITDPPYGIQRAKSNTISGFHYSLIDEEWDRTYHLGWLDDAIRILKPDGQLLIFCSYHMLRNYLNWNEPRQIIHFVKINPVPSLRDYYWHSVEYILWYTKSDKFYFNKKIGRKNVIELPICAGSERYNHPAQKPLELMKQLVLAHTEEDNIILDLFCGTGTTGVAAKQLGRRFILIEKDPNYIGIINQRLAQEMLF